jgi:hypothetical protein
LSRVGFIVLRDEPIREVYHQKEKINVKVVLSNLMKPSQSKINQSTPKKKGAGGGGGDTRNKLEGPMSKKTKEQREHQVSKPPPIARSISNKKRGL